MTEQNRRASDNLGEKIEELIVAATDPKDKAFLLILNKIADNLEENTMLTRSLSSELKTHTQNFQEHERKELSLINQGRGFLRGAIIALGVFQTGAGYILMQHIESHKKLIEEVRGLSEFKAAHLAHHETEERKK